jgi:hypothetical protein
MEVVMANETSDIPWGNLPTKERRQLQRLVQASLNAYSALRLCGHGQSTGFWGIAGTGGDAIANLKTALEACEVMGDEHGERFWRYARSRLSLLDLDPSGSWGWRICVDECRGKEWAVGLKTPDKCPFCNGPVRPLVWADVGEEEDAASDRPPAS